MDKCAQPTTTQSNNNHVRVFLRFCRADRFQEINANAHEQMMLTRQIRGVDGLLDCFFVLSLDCEL